MSASQAGRRRFESGRPLFSKSLIIEYRKDLGLFAQFLFFRDLRQFFKGIYFGFVVANN
jgi:hypothetical protein